MARLVHEIDVGTVFGVPCGDIPVDSVEISEEQLEILGNSFGILSQDPKELQANRLCSPETPR